MKHLWKSSSVGQKVISIINISECATPPACYPISASAPNARHFTPPSFIYWWIGVWVGIGGGGGLWGALVMGGRGERGLSLISLGLIQEWRTLTRAEEHSCVWSSSSSSVFIASDRRMQHLHLRLQRSTLAGMFVTSTSVFSACTPEHKNPVCEALWATNVMKTHSVRSHKLIYNIIN